MLLPIIVFGQKASPQLLSNAGNITETSEIKVSWTLGEFAIATIGQNPKLTQGMQQSKLTIETKVVDPEYLDQIELYPNPTSDMLNIKVNRNAALLNLQIYDMNGKLVFSKAAETTMSIDLKQLSKGIYLVSLSNKKQIVYVSQVIKL
jgi:hypothetical protein